MKRFLLVVLLYAVGFGSHAQRVTVEKYYKGRVMDPMGIFYALPKTILDIEIEMVKVVTKKPEDPKMCDKVLGDCEEVLGQMPYSDGVEFNIRSVIITSKAVPDTANIYRVNPSSKWNKRKTIGFSFSERGTIKGANIDVEDTTIEMILSIVSAASNFFMKSRLPEQPIDTTGLDSTDYKKYMNKKEKINELLAAKVMLISSPNIDGSKEILEFKIKEVDKLLAVELKELIGSKVIKPFTLKLPIDIKDTTYLKKQDVLTVYEQNFKTSGVVLNTDILPEYLLPYPLVRQKNGVGGITKFLKMDIKLTEGLGNTVKVRTDSLPPKKGLPYRIPADVLVKLTYGQETEPNPIYQGTVGIAQLGPVAYLPYKMDSADLTLYEETGGIQSLTVTANPVISSDDITKIDSLGQTIKGKSEPEKLQERIDILTLRKQLEELLNNESEDTDEN
ncbi:DUF4831 family protein [Allomuricauda taeanensis]|uniref:DUF4831 family protein n=1 Tax=Flagellimonas taeanensis TaxID=1005926 RepID=UPI002E7B5646|nr:DUF4831 family protein [Allomuricauda taeanensis]MEE1962772.1 DUF4831 family protein [Allomuricauda taeanensis]